jgi:chaperonin GroEL (HSP60 family)
MTWQAQNALCVPIASGQYEDLMAGGIIDPTKVIRCCLENSVSVAKVGPLL